MQYYNHIDYLIVLKILQNNIYLLFQTHIKFNTDTPQKHKKTACAVFKKIRLNNNK